MEALDDVEVTDKDAEGPIRIPIIDRYKEQGRFVVMGKIESGVVREGDDLVISPTKEVLKVVGIETDFSEGNIKAAFPGENVYLVVKGVDLNNVNTGYILSDTFFPAPSVKTFRGSVVITNAREKNPIFCAGSTAVMHIHTLTIDVTFQKIVAELGPDRKPICGKNGKPVRPRFVKKGSNCLIDFTVEQSISLEIFNDFKTLSTFTLRDESLTLAIGKVTKIIN